MKFFSLALLASSALAAPLEPRHYGKGVTDADILQYALTLEHLENVFYKEALAKFPRQQFLDAGFSSEYYDNLKYIAVDEEQHVKLLTQALAAAGAKPVAACQYKFPFTDAKSFVTLSSVLEGVGTSAYLGGAPLIKSKEYLTVAGSILVTEAIHTSLQRFSIGEIAPANPYGTPLGINEVYTLAAAFITSCPPTNPKLPVKAFPTLTATATAAVSVGQKASFKPAKPAKGPVYLTFVSGLEVTSVPATWEAPVYSAAVPKTASGQTYVILTSKAVKKVSDAVVLAGPAIIEVTPPAPVYDPSVRM